MCTNLYFYTYVSELFKKKTQTASIYWNSSNLQNNNYLNQVECLINNYELINK